MSAGAWVHGASVGDARALVPLVAGLRRRAPDLQPVLSFQTRGGRAVARGLFPDLQVVRPPLDLPPWPGWALDRRRPRLLILEYLELWPAWVAACVRRGVPVAVVDGRVSHRSLRARVVLRAAAGRLSLFCARSEGDAQRAAELGVRPERIRVTGNGKHDGAIVGPPPIPPELSRAVGAPQVVIGSLHPDEEAACLSGLAASGLSALIAPRYPRRAAALLRRARGLGVSAALRSAGGGARWVVLDTLGELAAAYGLGRVAVVGGTFGRREGQNLVEPAAHGRPVVHGPRVANVAEEASALRGRGAHPVQSWVAAFAAVRRLLDAPGPDPRAALAELRGATARNLDALGPLLLDSPSPAVKEPR